MADESDRDKTKVEEAQIGVKADVKTLQQLSSSGRAAQAKREENQVQKGFRSLGEAVQEQFGEGGSGNQERPGQQSES